MDARIYAELAKKLIRARKGARLTQQQLADAIGLSRGSIANIERGKQRIHLDTLYLIAGAVGKEPEDLLPRPSGVDLDKLELGKFPASVRGMIEQIARAGQVNDA